MRCHVSTPELLNEVVDDSDPDLDLPQVRAAHVPARFRRAAVLDARPNPRLALVRAGPLRRCAAQQPRFALRASVGKRAGVQATRSARTQHSLTRHGNLGR